MFKHYQDKDSSMLTWFGKAVLVVAGAIFGFLILRIFVFTPFFVQDDTMLPNYNNGNYVIVLKHITPKPGDVVLFENPRDGKVMLKRVLAAGKNTIEVAGKEFIVNGLKYNFKWKIQSGDSRIFQANFTARDNMAQRQMKQNEIFVIGDNIDYSYDSREFGAINEDSVIGKVIFKF